MPDDRFLKLTLVCEQCGVPSQASARWAMVGQRLKAALECEVHLFGRCAVCGSISYNPGLPDLATVMEFFQVISTPDTQGQPTLECVTYDVGTTSFLETAGEGLGSPLTTFSDPLGRKMEIMPAMDLTFGLCAEPGKLPLGQVKEALISVAREHPV